jgi:large subunit ribosomal protein L24
MQKLIARTERAQRSALRAANKAKEHKSKGESWERNQNKQRVLRNTNNLIREERKNRRLDWQAGPLAPRRDVGEKQLTYGALTVWDTARPELDPEQRPKWWHIREGDRVVITRGRERGKIGMVDDINEKTAHVRVKDLNQFDVHMPEWMKQRQGETRDVVAFSQHVPLDDVKLVYPLPHPETGVYRDVVIERLVPVGRERNATELAPKEVQDRAIPGTTTIIPWPAEAEEEFEDFDDDTPRISVDTPSFLPHLLRQPMPGSVIDELRNKYSKFRTRHDYDYRMKKEQEDAKLEGRKGLIKTMRTPLQELADLRAKQKAAEKKKLTAEQLAKIGEVIASEQARTAAFAEAVQKEAA